MIGDAAAHVRGRGAGLSCVLLDAFDRDGGAGHLLTADGFLRDACDALAAGGTLVVNRFNGVDGSAERAVRADRARAEAAGFAEVYSLGVDGLSVVLVAHPPPGRAAPASTCNAPRAPRGKPAARWWRRRAARAAAALGGPRRRRRRERAAAAAREPREEVVRRDDPRRGELGEPRWMGVVSLEVEFVNRCHQGRSNSQQARALARHRVTVKRRAISVVVASFLSLSCSPSSSTRSRCACRSSRAASPSAPGSPLRHGAGRSVRRPRCPTVRGPSTGPVHGRL